MSNKIKATLYIGTISLVLILVFISIYLYFYVSDSKKQKLENEIAECAIIYLNNKYGDYDFNVADIQKSYRWNDAVNKIHIGYKLNVSCNLFTGDFILNIDGTTSQTITVKNEEFLEKYYNEIATAYLLEKFELLKFDMKIESEKIPVNLRTSSFI